jgi:hypothetical protein
MVYRYSRVCRYSSLQLSFQYTGQCPQSGSIPGIDPSIYFNIFVMVMTRMAAMGLYCTARPACYRRMKQLFLPVESYPVLYLPSLLSFPTTPSPEIPMRVGKM